MSRLKPSGRSCGRLTRHEILQRLPEEAQGLLQRQESAGDGRLHRTVWRNQCRRGRLMIKIEKEKSGWRLAVERDLVHKEKCLPFRANQFMLSGDNFTEVIKRAPGYLRFVISDNATTPASQPDFGRAI